LLLSPDFPAVANFGQPSIQTSEPCGKRSFVRRFIATSISPVVRAFRHVVETRYDACGKRDCAPSPLKAARTILTAFGQVKIACYSLSSLICQDLLQVFQSDSNPFAALQKRLIAANKLEGVLHLRFED
jgi:hypothetical protein